MKDQGTLNITTVSSKDWYKIMLEEKLTMETTENGERRLIRCRAELQHPQNDWEISWRIARIQGLESDQITLLWKVLHNLLPTQSRLYRILQDQNSTVSSALTPWMTCLIYSPAETQEMCVRHYLGQSPQSCQVPLPKKPFSYIWKYNLIWNSQ